MCDMTHCDVTHLFVWYDSKHVCRFVGYAALKSSWNTAGVEPGNQQGPGC